MDFRHTDERRMLADTLERYISQDYPLADRLEAGQSDLGFSRAKWAELAELGIPGMMFDTRNGGFGGQGFDLMVVFQAVGKGLIVEPLLASAVLAGGALAMAGNAAQKTRIEGLISGQAQAAFAHFEAADGWDPRYIATSATRTHEGWRLNGEKAVVRNAGSADFLVVSARSAGKPGDDAGLSLFLLPRRADGVTIREYQTIDGGRAAEVTLDNVVLDHDALIGVEGRGDDILTAVLGRGVFCLCAEALGLMDAIRDLTLEYLRQRQQFGVPIGKFQALQHRMATLLLEIEQARAAVINAAANLDSAGVPRERALSAAKFTIAEVGTLVAEESIQMHGGMGMTWEYPLGHFAKRLTMIGQEMGDGDFHLTRYMRLGQAG